MTATEEIADDRVLVVARVIDAPRSLVFNAWIDPDLIARWWGPRDFVTISHKMDISPGGAYRFGMRSPGGTEHWKRGVYREIVAPERIVLTFAWEDSNGQPGHETLITVTFEDLGLQTRLTLRQTGFETVAWRDDHRGGWTSCLERFAEFVTTA